MTNHLLLPPFGTEVPVGTQFVEVEHAHDPNGFRDQVVRGRTLHILLDYDAGVIVGKVKHLGSGALSRIELEGGIDLNLRNVSKIWVERRPCLHKKISRRVNESLEAGEPIYICTDDDRPDCHHLFTVSVWDDSDA